MPDWVICGGESGPGARPMHPDWARGLRDQCVEAGVPFFFKQWGEWAPLPTFHYSPAIGSGNREYNKALKQYRREHKAAMAITVDGFSQALMDGKECLGLIGKKVAGRLLDGKLWDQRP